jgi:hypothetical protein
VLVIIGLVAGRQLGWIWMDPLMGLIATVVIMSWSWSLVRTDGLPCCSTFLLIPLCREKLPRGLNNVVIGFRTFIYGGLVPATSPLSFQW